MKSPNTLHGISTIYHRRCGLSLSGVTSAYSTDGPLRRRARSAECRRPSEGAAYSLQYDMLKDFEPVSLLTTNPLLIVTNKTVPTKDLKELILWLKANQNKASVGTGSMVHRVSGVYFQTNTGIQLLFVPYRGAAPATQDMIAGQITLMGTSKNSSRQVAANLTR